jgi:Epoxide hydrolase N terminus
MADIQPFTIAVPDVALETLQKKLELATFPQDLDDAGWTFGSPLHDIKRLTNHWTTDYNWRKAEAELNKLPQFTTKVPIKGFGDLDIHFVYKKSPRANAIPLLFSHGCELFVTYSPLFPNFRKTRSEANLG